MMVALSAWWTIPKSVLEEIAAARKIVLTGCRSLFDVVFALTKGVLEETN